MTVFLLPARSQENTMHSTLMRHLILPLALVTALAVAPASAAPSPIEQARAALNHGDTDAAIALLEKAVAQTPNNAEAHYVLANAYGTKAQEAGMLAGAKYGMQSKEENEKAVALDPKYIEPRYSLVQLYAMAPAMMGGSFDKALEHAKTIKTLDPVWGHRAYAFIYSRQNKPDLAKQEYLDAIREQPASAKAHVYYGQYLATVVKSYGEAFAEFEAALKVDPKYMPSLYYVGRTAAQADSNLARGEATLKTYLGYTPKPGEPSLSSSNYYLGLVYEKEGKKAEAKKCFETTLKLNPTNKDAAEALKRVS
jgi:Tfp pilus assembly protein PilF